MSAPAGSIDAVATDTGSISKLRWRLRELMRQVWVRVAAFAILGALTAVAGFALKGFIPDDLPAKIGADAIEAILQILASSMLAVTTFSLSILTAAYASAGTTATPRAVHLLVSDSVSQTVLATFIGAFLFSLVSIILLKTGVYGEAGRLVLFAVTILVVAVVVLSLLRWIDQLGRLGRVGDTLTRVEKAAYDSLQQRLKAPWLGGNPLTGAPPPTTEPLFAEDVGYLQHCDTARLSKLADDAEIQIYLSAAPGDFLHPAEPVMHIRPSPADPDELARLRDDLVACLTIGARRDFDQDPRFGLLVLSEIAQRALSPAVNDPGTAELTSGHILAVLGQWRSPVEPDVSYPRLYVPSIRPADIMADTLLPIARDGRANYQVQYRLQQVLLALARLGPQVYADAAADVSRDMLSYSDAAIELEHQRQRLHQIQAWISDQAESP